MRCLFVLRINLPRGEEIKEELTGSSLFREWLYVPSAVNTRCLTEFAKLADIITVKKL